MQVSKRIPLFRALGRKEPPPEVLSDGTIHRLIEVYKHDSWAATALYGAEDGSRIMCKFNRISSIFFVPMKWLGRALARRENWFYRELAGIEGIALPVDVRGVGGERLPNVSAHVFIEGKPFRHAEDADDRFFDRLADLVAALHQRNIAYVDLHKRENIIVDPQGRPHLIDFQVSYALGNSWPANGAIARRLLKTLIAMDHYHLNKHFARCRPDLLPPEEVARMQEPPALVRWHRKIAVPLRTLRRALLVRLGIRSGKGMAESELDPEFAFRSDDKKTGSQAD